MRKLSKFNYFERFLFILGFSYFIIQPVAAGETVSYTYDPQGRLIETAHAGDGATASLDIQYQYDLAGNRLSQKISGSANKGQQVVVLPMNGFTVIPLNT